MNLFHQSAIFNKFKVRESLAKQARKGFKNRDQKFSRSFRTLSKFLNVLISNGPKIIKGSNLTIYKKSEWKKENLQKIIFFKPAWSSHKKSTAHAVKFSSSAKSTTYVLLVIWISIGNLMVIFTSFTWNQYARAVDSRNYEKIVENYGAFAWTAAVFRKDFKNRFNTIYNF